MSLITKPGAKNMRLWKYCLFSMAGIIVNDLHSSLSPRYMRCVAYLTYIMFHVPGAGRPAGRPRTSTDGRHQATAVTISRYRDQKKVHDSSPNIHTLFIKLNQNSICDSITLTEFSETAPINRIAYKDTVHN